MTGVVVVTGASGFVGSHLARGLARRGYRVRCLVRRTSLLDRLPVPEVELHYGDVTEPATLGPLVEGADRVFHAAALTRARDPEEYRRVNAEGTRNLVRAVRENAPALSRFVLVSSLAAGGTSEPDRLRRESDPDRPHGAYGRSKKEAEEILREEGGALPWTVLRPAAVYGPGDRDFLVLARMAARGLLVRVGRREQRVTVLHVEDLVAGAVASSEAGTARGETYYLAHPEVTTWTGLGRALAAALGKRPHVVLLPRTLVPAVGRIANAFAGLARRPAPFPPDRLRDLLAPAWTCSVDKAREAFGFRPAIGAGEGMASLARWYLEERWL
jgi:nucleoside-diphosphate-sugar epimerase